YLFSNDTPTTDLYTLSLHDALPIYPDTPGIHRAKHTNHGSLTHGSLRFEVETGFWAQRCPPVWRSRLCANNSTPIRTAVTRELTDRKSTRLNSSHVAISYAVFCLKK